MTKLELVKALREEAKDKLKLATRSLGRSPSTLNMGEAIFLLDEAVPILQVANRIRGDIEDEQR